MFVSVKNKCETILPVLIGKIRAAWDLAAWESVAVPHTPKVQPIIRCNQYNH